MKVAIQTWGSNGDLRPFCALAYGFIQQGHEVTLVLHSVHNYHQAYYETLSKKMGFRLRYTFYPLPPEALERFTSSQDLAEQAKVIFEMAFVPYVPKVYQISKELCSSHDLVIAGYIMYPLRIAAEAANIPCYTVSICHGFYESKYTAPNGFIRINRFTNKFLWKLVQNGMNELVLPYINDIRTKEKLTPIKNAMKEGLMSKELNLIAVTPTIAKKHKDWPTNIQVCGFFDIPLEMEDDWPIPNDLQNFMETSPIYVTLGSMLDFDLRVTHLLTEAVIKADVKAIIQSRWDELEIPDHPNIYKVTKAPHRKIFPHCSLVIHHSGSGVTQSALLAGKPSIAIEHFGDQIYFATSIKDLKVGKYIRKSKVSADKLAKLIKKTLQDNSMKKQAQVLGKKIQAEDGVTRAVQILLSKVSNPVDQ